MLVVCIRGGGGEVFRTGFPPRSPPPPFNINSVYRWRLGPWKRTLRREGCWIGMWHVRSRLRGTLRIYRSLYSSSFFFIFFFFHIIIRSLYILEISFDHRCSCHVRSFLIMAPSTCDVLSSPFLSFIITWWSTDPLTSYKYSVSFYFLPPRPIFVFRLLFTTK